MMGCLDTTYLLLRKDDMPAFCLFVQHGIPEINQQIGGNHCKIDKIYNQNKVDMPYRDDFCSNSSKIANQQQQNKRQTHTFSGSAFVVLNQVHRPAAPKTNQHHSL